MNEKHTSNYFDGVDEINLSQLQLPSPAINILRQPRKVVNSDRKVYFTDEAKKLLCQHISKNTKLASSTPLVRLCIFIVPQKGLICDIERVFC